MNSIGTHPLVSKGASCATTLRAACKNGSIQQRGALNYGIVRDGGSADTQQLTAQVCGRGDARQGGAAAGPSNAPLNSPSRAFSLVVWRLVMTNPRS